MGTATTIIHVSDLHLSDPRGALLSIAASPKRALALLSWTTKRRKRLNPVVLEAARRDLIAAPGEALVITGDLTNLGLPREYREARRFLQSMDDHLDVVLVPGNHDACAAEPWDETLAEWAPWLASDEDQATPFPSLRVRGLAAL
ncbi:MAG: metallophosphoesterase, partial [Planctomycetes bacterium]|nr:metallophosphoesterase [Planctomycetota bacterium]